MQKIVLWFSLLITTLPLFAALPESVPIAVTYYDYHSNRTCPDFNPIDDRVEVTKNMVADKLVDGNLAPGSRVYFSSFIDKWFIPFAQHKDKNKRPVYIKDDTNEETHGTLRYMYNDTRDTAYKNIVIDDFLNFDLIDNVNGLYSFSSDSFFPIDAKGFGKELTYIWDGSEYNLDHNYSFTMRLDREFTYRSGRDWYFSIEGDDDIWVFINGIRVIDLGGIHESSADSICLDDIAIKTGLVDKEVYTLSLFFAERQATGSHLNIRWNFAFTNSAPTVVSPLTDLLLKEDAADTIVVDCDTIFLDDDALTYSVLSSDSTLFIPEMNSDNKCVIKTIQDAYGSAEIILVATDSEGLTVEDTALVTIESVNDEPVVIASLVEIELPEDFADTTIGDVSPIFKDDGALVFSARSTDSTLFIPELLGNSLTLTSLSNAYGEAKLLITAADDEKLEAVDTVLIKVSSVNDTPVLVKALEDVVIQEDAVDTVLHLLPTYFSDDDDLVYSLTLSNSSLVTLIVDGDNAISFTSVKDAYGELDVVVTATDTGSLFVVDTFTLTIESVNDAPVLSAPIADMSLPENCADTVIADLQTVFKDDDLLTFHIKSSDSTLIVPFKNSNDSLGLFLQNDAFGSCSVFVTAEDTEGLTVSDTVFITVIKGNKPPILTKKIDDCVIDEDAAPVEWTNLNSHFSDEATLTYRVQSSDSSLIVPVIKDLSLLRFAPVANANGVASIVVTAQDEYNLLVSDTFTITVTPVNDTPVLLNPIGDMTLPEDSPVFTTESLDKYFSDDGVLTFTAEVVTEIFTIAVSPEQKMVITCNSNAHGSAPVVVTAKDSEGLLVTDTFTVTITPVNDVPYLIGKLPDVSFPAIPGTKAIGVLDSLFKDDGTLVYSVAASDSTNAIGIVSGSNLLIDIKTVENTAVTLVVVATDEGGLFISDTMVVTLQKQIAHPVVIKPIVDQQLLVNSGPLDVVDLTTVFQSSEVLQFSAVSLNETLVEVTLREKKVCVLTPQTDAVGQTSIIVRATDPLNQFVEDTFTVMLYKENKTPVLLHPLSDLAVVSNHADTIIADLDTLFTDDGLLTFTVSSSDSTLVVGVINLEKELIINFLPERAGEAELVITAIDGAGLTASDTIDVVVASGNVLPTVVSPVQDIVVLKNSMDTTVAILAEVFSDDGPLKYRISSGNEELVICNLDIDGRVILSFIPEAVGETDIVLTATDSYGAVASDIFKVIVNSKNETPILVTPFTDVSLLEDSDEVTVGDLNSFFADETVLNFQVTVLDESLLASVLDAKSVLKLQPKLDAFGSSSVLVRATDIEGLFVEDTFSVVVTSVNDAPQIVLPMEDVLLTEDDPTYLGALLNTHFKDDDILTYSCEVSNLSIITVEVNSDTQLKVTPKLDAFGVTEVICTATDTYGIAVSDTIRITVQRDGNDNDDIFDEDMGMVLDSRVLGISAAPNPLTRDVSIMKVQVEHANADRIEAVLFSVIGDEVVTAYADLLSSETANLSLDLRSLQPIVGGQSFLLYVKHYRDNKLVHENTLTIGVQR